MTFLKMMNMGRRGISPAVYSLFQHFQPTTATVEESFSMLRKLLAKNRNIKVGYVKRTYFYISIFALGDCKVGGLYWVGKKSGKPV